MISEVVQGPSRMPTETNRQGNQRPLLVINAAAEAEKNIIKIKATLQPYIGSNHPRKFMGSLGGNLSNKMSVLVSIFQLEENNSVVVEKMEEYVLAYAETAYEYPV